MRGIFRSLFLPVVALAEAIFPFWATSGNTQIVPKASISGKSLMAVIAIMSFLACLTAGAVYMVNQSADAWFRDIASEVTVQISPVAERPMKRRIQDVTLFLSRQKGVAKIRPLSLSESNELLEPWLGKSNAFESLPVPRLVALELDRTNPPDLKKLGRRLNQQFKKVILDDHRHWQAQIRTVTRSVALGGIVLLILVAMATTAMVISATKAAMASNKDIIEVLHFVGAKQSFISNEFERHFLVTGIRAGILGALAATLAFWTMPVMMRFLGGDGVTMAELKRFVGNATLDMNGHFTLAAVVIVVSAICVFTSRYWVNMILNTNDNPASGPKNTPKQFGFTKPPQKAHNYEGTQPTLLTGKQKLMKIGFRTLSTILLIALAALILGFGMFIASIEKSQKLPSAAADGIVVLTGGKSRIDESIKLLAAGKGRRLLISGVNDATGENQLIRLSPASEPLFDCCIDLGKKAQNTFGNAEEIAEWTRKHGFKSLIFVTSNYHMPRSLAETRRFLPDTDFRPYAVLPDRFKDGSWWRDPSTMFLLWTEYLKNFRTRTRALFSPKPQ